MRKTFSAAVLVLVLTCVAFGGDMPNGAPAPPQTVNATQEQPTGSEIQPTPATNSTATEIMLTLLNSVFSLL